MKAIVRKARLEDPEKLSWVALKLFKYHLKYNPFFDEMSACARAELVKFLKKSILSKNQFLVLAEMDSEIIGYALASINKRPAIYKQKKMCLIEELFVEKKARGKGISRKLFNEVRKFSQNKKIKMIQVRVSEKNSHAIQIYKKFEFKEYDKVIALKI